MLPDLKELEKIHNDTLASQTDQNMGSLPDLNELQAIHNESAKQEEFANRGFVRGLASDVAGGVVSTFGEQIPQALRAVGKITGSETVENMATPMIEGTRQYVEEHPFLQPDPTSTGFAQTVHSGVRSVAQSLATHAIPTAVGAVAGGPAGAVAGYVAGGAPLFGLSQYDDVLERADKAGIPREKSEPAAIKEALAETGFEYGSDALDVLLLGHGRLLTAPGKEALKEGISSMFGRTLKQRLGTMAGIAGAEIPMEMATSAVEADQEKKLGLGSQSAWEAAKEAFGPTLVASMIFGGLGEAGIHLDKKRVQHALENPKVNPESRMRAADEIYSTLSQVDPAIADVWGQTASAAIDENKPITMNQDLHELHRKITNIEKTPEKTRSATQNGNLASYREQYDSILRDMAGATRDEDVEALYEAQRQRVAPSQAPPAQTLAQQNDALIAEQYPETPDVQEPIIPRTPDVSETFRESIKPGAPDLSIQNRMLMEKELGYSQPQINEMNAEAMDRATQRNPESVALDDAVAQLQRDEATYGSILPGGASYRGPSLDTLTRQPLRDVTTPQEVINDRQGESGLASPVIGRQEESGGTISERGAGEEASPDYRNVQTHEEIAPAPTAAVQATPTPTDTERRIQNIEKTPEKNRTPQQQSNLERFKNAMEASMLPPIGETKVEQPTPQDSLQSKNSDQPISEHGHEPEVAQNAQEGPLSGGEVKYSLEHHPKVAKRIAAGDITAEELKAEYQNLLNNEQSIRDELNKRTVKQLAPNGTFGKIKKSEIVDSILDRMKKRFVVKDSFSWSPMEETHSDALNRVVNATTNEDIQAAAKKKADNVAQMKKALTNPETLSEFRDFIAHKGEQSLSTDQRVKYDELLSKQAKTVKGYEEERKSIVKGVNLGAVNLKYQETTHTKTGAPLHVVQLSEKVEKDIYTELNRKARQLGGWYSSYRKDGAVPGFQFNTKEAAEKFMALQEGDVSRKDLLEEKQQERTGKKVERLRTQAENLASNANESLNRDRNTNTARRARMASSAEASARADLAMSETMHNLADAIESGEATHLDGVGTKADIDTLDSALRRAKQSYEREKNITYAESQKRSVSLDDIQAAEYPFPYVHRSRLMNVIKTLSDLKGSKQLASKIQKIMDAVTTETKDYGHITNPGDIETIREASTKNDAYDFKALKESLTHYDRLKRMGIDDLPSLRAALREYLTYRGKQQTPDKIKEIERAMIGKKLGVDFFPTPKAVAEDMVARADIEPGMKVLEPSAGNGNIAEAIRNAGATPDVVELSGDLRDLLREKKFNVVGMDFTEVKPIKEWAYDQPWKYEEYDDWPRQIAQNETRAEIEKEISKTETDRSGLTKSHLNAIDATTSMQSQSQRRAQSGNAVVANYERNSAYKRALEIYDHFPEKTKEGGILTPYQYDRILMNPPFSKNQDIEHVQHAYDLLNPGGKIVAIMGEGAFFREGKTEKAFRDWLEQVGAKVEKLPEGTFKDKDLLAQTGVNARMVEIEKPNGSAPTSRASLSESQPQTGITIQELDSHIEPILAKWKNAPKIVPVQTVEDIPASVKDGFGIIIGTNERIRGLYHPESNSIYMILGNIKDRQDAQETLLHEGFHGAIRNVLGDKLDPFLKETFAYYGKKGLEPIAKAYKLDLSVPADRMIAAEEKIAQLAETGERPGFLKRLYGAIRDALRAMGFTIKINDADIQRMIARTQRNLEREPVHGNMDVLRRLNEFAQSTRMSLSEAKKKITDNPNFRKWFGDSKVVDEKGEPLVVYHGTPYGNFNDRAKSINSERNRLIAEYEQKKSEWKKDYEALNELEQELWKKHGDFTSGTSAYRQLKDLKNEFGRPPERSSIPIGEEEGDIFRYVGNNDPGYLGEGFYFSASKDVAGKWANFPARKSLQGETYDPYIYAVYLDIKKPYYHGSTEITEEMAREERKIYNQISVLAKDVDSKMIAHAKARSLMLQKFGYDGIIGESHGKQGIEYVVFAPTQIKSVFNSGGFDRTNPDIRFSIKQAASDELHSVMSAIDEARHPEDATLFQTVLQSPEWRTDPNERAAFLATQEREDRKNEIFMKHIAAHDALAALKFKGMNWFQKAKTGFYDKFHIDSRLPKDYRDAAQILDRMDTEEIPWDELKPQVEGNVSKEVIHVVSLVRKAYDDILEMLRKSVKDIIDQMERGEITSINLPGHFFKNVAKSDLELLKRETGMDSIREIIESDEMQTHDEIELSNKNRYTRDDLEAIRREFGYNLSDAIHFMESKNTESTNIALPSRTYTKNELLELYHAMGELKGFFSPRIRPPGDFYVTGKDANGQFPRYHEPTRRLAEKRKLALAREGLTDLEVGQIAKLPEDVYQDLNIIDMGKAIEHAIETSNIGSEEAKAALKGEALLSASNVIKARGFRAHKISRTARKENLVRGYLVDPLERYTLYLNQIAGGIAKGEAAMKMYDALAKVPASTQPKRYERLRNYILEQLRNPDRVDRMVARGKAIVAFKYLGINPRSAFVNTTAQITTVPPSILKYALDNNGSLTKIMGALYHAGKDYTGVMLGKKLSDTEEQAFMDDIHEKRYDQPKLARDAMRNIQDALGSTWSKVMEGSMWMFGKTEQWNRGSTMLAAYRLAKTQGATHELAMEKARLASDKAHGIYGKGSLPAWAQGANPFAKFAQMGYSFSKFSHNYLQMLYDHGISKETAKGLAFALLSPAAVGGASAFVGYSVLLGVVKGIMRALGDDREPEKMFWDTVRENLGSGTEKVGRYGAAGAIGVDLTGTLAIGMQLPKNVLDLIGPFGGVAQDIGSAAHFAATGQPGKAVERIVPTQIGNIMRASREYLNGATTTAGNRVWDEDGKPYMPSVSEALKRASGFRASDRATLEARQREAKVELMNFSEARTSIYEEYRAYLSRSQKDPQDLKGIMDRIARYNKSVQSDGRTAVIPMITRQSMQRQVMKMRKPNQRTIRAIRQTVD